MLPTLKEKIYADILNKVMLGDIAQGELLSEVKLAEQFQVSRAPVREALVALCNEGILQTSPRVGYRVVAIPPEEVREVLAVRHLLERQAAILALQSLDDARRREIDELIRAEAIDDQSNLTIIEWMHHGEAVHYLLARFAGNRTLENLIKDLIRKLRMASTQVYLRHSHSDLKSSKYHLKILQALRAGNRTQLLANLAKDIGLTDRQLNQPDSPAPAVPSRRRR